MTDKNTVALDESGNTSMDGVFAGGDIARGGATVLLAMKDGIENAQKILNYLKGKTPKSTKK